MSTNPFATAAVGGAGFGAFAPSDQTSALSSDEPAWKQEFKATLDEIHKKGFAAYAKEIQDKKVAEMREKILKSMGLTEDALNKMAPEARASIEKVIADEIRKRMTAELALDANAKAAQASTAKPGEIDPAEIQASQNGFSAGMTLIKAMESHPETVPGKRQDLPD